MAFKPFRLRNRSAYVLSGLMAIAIIIATSISPAAFSQDISQDINDSLRQLPAQEQAALQGGDATVTGGNGQFTGRVLINASAPEVWQVLTDYDNFERFFPNIETSRLLESSDNRSVFEQINVVQVFLFTQRSRIVVASTENYPQQIDFSLVEGDLESLQGSWQIESISSSPNQVLITHQVSVEPNQGGAVRNVFFGIYQNVLEDTLAALKQEAERRINS
ncbi:MAG: SRPBCC family protein [Elainellaceae cyanobacterium]